MSTTLRVPHQMTLAEFEAWEPPGDLPERCWELVDGEPVCMSPPSADHGAIQAELGYLLSLHMRQHRPGCRVIQTPGIVPRLRETLNARIPDLGVTCSPDRAAHYLPDPVLLIDILSSSNAAKTRANVWAYATLPSVAEILIVSSTSIAAELLRRDAAGDWPASPAPLGPADTLHLASIGLTFGLRDAYVTSSLA